MRDVIHIEPATTEGTRDDLLHRLDIPPDMVTPRLNDLIESARARFLRVARPRGVLKEVSGVEFATIFEGDGANAAAAPMDEIVPRAHGFALFAATLGQELDDDVREMFAHGDPAQGFMLDMVASSAADRLAHLMADAFMAALAASGRASDGWHALPYSPGYCGWHVSGQRALFDRLEPAAAGIALTSSCLMQPIKSVSGVVIVGPAQAHRFRPNYPFCDVCATRECLPRMASTKGKRK